MSRYITGLTLAATLALPQLAFAQSGSGFGLGLILGDPDGLSFKSVAGGEWAIDGALGLDLLDDGHIVGHVDGLRQSPLTDLGGAPLSWYFGVGLGLALYDHDHARGRDDSTLWLGARAPLGLAWEFQSVPIDIFLEAALYVWVIQDVDVDGEGALGARFWF